MSQAMSQPLPGTAAVKSARGRALSFITQPSAACGISARSLFFDRFLSWPGLRALAQTAERACGDRGAT